MVETETLKKTGIAGLAAGAGAFLLAIVLIIMVVLLPAFFPPDPASGVENDLVVGARNAVPMFSFALIVISPFLLAAGAILFLFSGVARKKEQ